MTRRLLAMLLAALMMVSALPVYAAEEALNDNATFAPAGPGIDPEPIFCEDGTVMWFAYDDQAIYGFSVSTEGTLHFCFSTEGSGISKAYDFTDVPLLTGDFDLRSSEFRWSIWEYCMEQKNDAPYDIYVAERFEAVPFNSNRDFLEIMESVYGKEYDNKVLKTDTTSYRGYTIVVKEMLDISVVRNDHYRYKGNQKILEFVTSTIGQSSFMARNHAPEIAQAIKTMYNLPGDIFLTSGAVDFWNCTAVRHRYTEVNGKGPYSSTTKSDYLLGIDDYNDPVDVQVRVLEVQYTPNQSHYQESSYSSLIRDAYQAYN
jgi:hypothetical protein